jgi:hypothetical protein
MSDAPLHHEAVHEAGHAVMARRLGARIHSIKIDLADPHGAAEVNLRCWPNGPASPDDDYRVACSSEECLGAFGFDFGDGHGSRKDRDRMVAIVLEKFPDDEATQDHFRTNLNKEVGQWFEQPNVRSAVVELVEALMREGQISGTEAEAIIDRHLA